MLPAKTLGSAVSTKSQSDLVSNSQTVTTPRSINLNLRADEISSIRSCWMSSVERFTHPSILTDFTEPSSEDVIAFVKN